MSEPLFIEPVREKVAMEARLSDNADTWAEEVLQEVYKQHPYVGNYDVIPVMRDVEDERGYGLGHLIVKNKSGRLNTEAGQLLAQEAGVRTAKIPVIIENQKLKALDLFIDPRGRTLPLNEERLRESMFRGDLFDAYAPRPSPVNLIGDQFVPPNRSERLTAGRGTVVEQGEVKTGSARPPLLQAIAPTILRTDLDRVEETLNHDQVLASRLISKHASLMKILADATPVSLGDIYSTTQSLSEPDTIQLSRIGEDYILKMAASQFYLPQVFVADRIKMASVLGEDAVASADESGVVSISTDPVVKDDFETDAEVVSVETFGEYKVRDVTDREHLGWVFPKVHDFDGTAVPMKVFTNGSASAIQADIAGTFVGKGTNIISSDKLEGDGFFYVLTQDGSALAFIPGSILGPMEDPEGPAIRFLSMMGVPYVLRMTPGLKKPEHLGGGEYAIPITSRWCPMTGPALTLVSNATMFGKTAAAILPERAVTVISDGRAWTFSGSPVEKLAEDQKQFLEAEDAVFLACALGMAAPMAIRKLAQAGQRGSVTIPGCRPIVPAAELRKQAEEKATSILRGMPPKYLLLKEAAGLDDVSTVDKILSLGFLTPENVGTFIDYIPEFEESIHRLAYLLLAVRVGLPDVPELSVKNAMERLEEVLQSLKKLLYRKA
jgi:hypothetical protein